MKFVCARFGWINTTNSVASPLFNWTDKSVWCSYGDLCQFIDRILENRTKLKKFQIYFVASNNDFYWADMGNAKEDINYELGSIVLMKSVIFHDCVHFYCTFITLILITNFAS